MSIQRINPDDIEIFTLTTNPPRTFSSSSLGIVSGTLSIFPRRSSIEKEVHALSNFSGSFQDQDLDVTRNEILLSPLTNKFNLLKTYLKDVNAQGSSLRKQQTVSIIRFEPSAQFSSNTLRKKNIIDGLMPFYRTVFPEAHFGFTNYHSINFLTGSGLPSDTALIYADKSKQYALTGAFSFDFWINPRYSNDFEGAQFKAGTILHRSSSFAVSLLSGSTRDVNGKVDSFKLLLQLSQSADISPSLAVANDLTFFSTDNVLKKNTWSHVTIRWGTSNYNDGSGSFLVDGQTVGTFVIPSASLPDNNAENCLLVGNYFEGTTIDHFFTNEVATRDGLDELVAGLGQHPANYNLRHALNAEVHELKIYNRYLNNDEVTSLQSQAPTSGSDLLHNGLLFYLPPFYTPESPYRSFTGTHGGILTTPFFEVDGATRAPINAEASFGAFGHYINLENYVRDFATGKYARLFNLTGSAITGTASTPTSFNDYLYASGSNLKRQMTILPNDNGRFIPNFTFMIPGLSDKTALNIPLSVTQSFQAPYKVDSDQFKNDLGNLSPGLVSLRNIVSADLFSTVGQGSNGSLLERLNGVSPENLAALPSTHGRYTVLQRTGDNSCNQVVFFDISNLYYGMNIEPGTLRLKDLSLSGSLGKAQISLIDDSEGNIYRADSLSTAPDWSSVGNIFYNEGIIILKHPSLYFFGIDQFEIAFKGTQNTHVLTYNLFKRSQLVTSSSNPNYQLVSASTNANEPDQKFTYITGINLHDDNLNIITKTSLAQPIVARTGDKFLFKVKMDF